MNEKVTALDSNHPAILSSSPLFTVERLLFHVVPRYVRGCLQHSACRMVVFLDSFTSLLAVRVHLRV